MNIKWKNIIVEVISLLYVLLFVYAATSKLLDFQHFKIELGQSPLLSAFADWFSILVPVIEYLICLLLVIPRLKLIGLFSAYGLMLMFSVYIFIILHYTSFVPCSCGGVLEKLKWGDHLIFNLVFLSLVVMAILFFLQTSENKNKRLKRKSLFGIFFTITFCSIAIVTSLFLLSENLVHYHNKLTRRFPQTPIHQRATTDLKLNSFYFAGADSTTVYLGNSTAPLLITTFDSKLLQTQKKMIDLDHKELPFRGVKIMVESPYFFVVDGTVPCVFRGKVKDWKAKLTHQYGEYFTTAKVIDSNTIAAVSNNKITGDNVLAVIQLQSNGQTILNPDILQKQTDGVFDTDGMLLYSKAMGKIIYLYAYRNEFTLADNRLKIAYRGNTIDTISKAQLQITEDKNHHQRQFSKPPLFVNKNSTVFKNLLFVHSAIPGRFEDDRMWKDSSIIDLYDLSKKSYVLSFCINDLDGKKMNYFTVVNNKLYVLVGTHIIQYAMDSKITSHYNKTSAENLLAK